MPGRQPIRFRWSNVGPLIVVRLGHRPGKTAQPVKIVYGSLAAVVAGQKTEPGPNHAVLHGKDKQLHKRIKLVAALAGGIGKPRRKFVLPPLFHPEFGSRVHKSLKRSRRAPHIRRRPKNDGVGVVEFFPIFVDILYLDQMNGRALDAGRALPNGFGLRRRMAIAGMIDNNDVRHDNLHNSKI